MAADPVCKIHECGKSVKAARGFCSGHYRKWRLYGDPLENRAVAAGQGVTQVYAREAALYQGEDCLIWPFSRTSEGYGQTWQDGKPIVASRVICALAHGPAPSPKHQAAHSCGRGHEGCVSPGHLRWATRKENEADKKAHGTRGKKLSADDVREMWTLRGKVTGREIARRFGVAPTCVSGIFKGHAWRDLAPDGGQQ